MKKVLTLLLALLLLSGCTPKVTHNPGPADSTDPGLTLQGMPGITADPLPLESFGLGEPYSVDDYGCYYKYAFQYTDSPVVAAVPYTEDITTEVFKDRANAAFTLTDYSASYVDENEVGDVYMLGENDTGSLALNYDTDTYMSITFELKGYTTDIDCEAWAECVAYHCGISLTAEDYKQIFEASKAYAIQKNAVTYGLTVEHPDTWDEVHVGIVDAGTVKEWVRVSVLRVIHRP